MISGLKNSNANNYKFNLLNAFDTIFENNDTFNWAENNINFILSISCVNNSNSPIVLYDSVNINDKIIKGNFEIDIPITDDWVSLLVEKTGGSWKKSGNVYNLNYIEGIYQLDLIIEINDLQEKYTNKVRIPNNADIEINDENRIVEEGNDIITITSINGEESINAASYSIPPSSNNIYQMKIKTIEGIDNIINLTNNVFNININYVVKLNNPNGIDRFVISKIEEKHNIGTIANLSDSTIVKDTDNQEENTTKYNPFAINYSCDDGFKALNLILESTNCLSIHIVSYDDFAVANNNEKILNIMIDEEEVNEYLFNKIKIVKRENNEDTDLEVSDEHWFNCNKSDITQNLIKAKFDDINVDNIFKISDDDYDINTTNKTFSVTVKLKTDDENINWSNTITYHYNDGTEDTEGTE